MILYCVLYFCCFFFKQKTAYEMRISDWSSDVCSSDLGVRMALEQFGSGLNSFQLLRHFDPAFLKIDRSFMSDLGKNTENQKKVVEIARQAEADRKSVV